MQSRSLHWMQCTMDAQKERQAKSGQTQIIWIGKRQQSAQVSAAELTLPSAMVSFLLHRGFINDSQWNMVNPVAHVCHSCYFQLRQLWQVWSRLTSDAVKALAHAFISSRLHYCNRLLTGIGNGVLMKLKSIYRTWTNSEATWFLHNYKTI